MREAVGSVRLEDLRAVRRETPVDPYPIYRHLLRHAPVWESPWGDTYVARYDDVAAIFRDPSCLQIPRSGNKVPTELLPAAPETVMGQWPIFLNRPKHSTVRGMLARLIGAVPPDALDRIISASAGWLADATGDGPFCLVERFSSRLPVAVICDLAAIPERDRGMVANWSVTLREILDVGFDAGSPAHADTLRDGYDYFVELSGSPGWRSRAFHGVWADLAGGWPKEVAASNLLFLVFSGHETTVHLIGSLVRLVAGAAGAWDSLRADRTLLPAAIDEALRLESPVQKLCRTNTRELVLGGGVVAAASSVVLLPGAANRDPRAFADPDQYDLMRSGPRHLAFGAGRHLCLGKSLSLREAEIGMGALLDRWAEVPVIGEMRFHPNSSFRALSRLEVSYARLPGRGMAAV